MIDISGKNRVLDYVKINKNLDKPIAEYVDYLAFYGVYHKESLIFRLRDNDAGMDVHGFHFTKFPTKGKTILKAQKFYKGKIVDVFQLKEIIVGSRQYLKVDMYGKGILIINRENLRTDFENCLQYFGLVGELVITRIDYAIDCLTMARNKKHSLKTKMRTEIANVHTGEIEYIRYGNPQTSAQFLRFYNKIIDLKKTNSLWLYPGYEKYDGILRYELQVQSDGIAEEDKRVYRNYIEHLCNFGLSCKKSKRSHHKHKVIDRDFILVKKKIMEYRKESNWSKLGTLAIMLEGAILHAE